MILSDRDIRAALDRQDNPLVITPLAYDAIQPASVDVRVAGMWKRQVRPWYNAGRPIYQYQWEECYGPVIVVQPGEFLLTSTLERVIVPADMVIQVNGKSTWARYGLTIHQTAGFLDPGFDGTVTLEWYNAGCDPVDVEVGKFIGQLVVMMLSSPAERPYGSPGLGSHYQHQRGPQEAR